MTDIQNVEEYLQTLSQKDTVLTRIALKIHQNILTLHPLATFEIKYGGLLYSVGCGIFTYSEHTSLEFSQGKLLEDDYKLLQGGGKHRRHIPFSTIEQANDRVLHYYLSQLPLSK